ncbi:MAG: diaminobutyrate--2-oxoglutarate transaminase, partial [Actinomycetota bacterium]
MAVIDDRRGDLATAADTSDEREVFERRESRVRSYCRIYDVVFDRAAGSHLYAEDGRAYIDFLAGCSTLNYGHDHPVARAALIEYLQRGGVAHGLDLHTVAKREFLETFERLILEPRGLDHIVQFTGPTGTNAVDAAMKLARMATGRRNIVSFTNAFHGVTSGVLAATGNASQRLDAWLTHTDTTRWTFDGYGSTGIEQLDLLDTLLRDGSGGIAPPAAFLVETVQGEGGLNVASAEWMQRLERIAHEHGAVLIVDDVQAGCGRTGTFFSFEPLGVTPDIVTVSKSISGYGLPMAMVLIRPALDQWAPAQHNGTFRGNSHAFVTATAVLDHFWSDARFEREISRKAELLSELLDLIGRQLPGSQRRGRGMFQGLDVGCGGLAEAVCRRAFELGLIIETCGPDGEVLKVLAPLTTDDATLRRGCELLAEALA